MTKQVKIIKMFLGLVGIVLGAICVFTPEKISDLTIQILGGFLVIVAIGRFVDVYQDKSSN